MWLFILTCLFVIVVNASGTCDEDEIAPVVLLQQQVHLREETDQPVTPCEECVKGAVIGGADVVEYFKLSPGEKGVIGSSEHAVSFRGYTFYFSNAANADTFKANPFKFVPAYGGFCYLGLAVEDHEGRPLVSDQIHHWTGNWLGPPADPINGWVVYEGKLFVSGGEVILNQYPLNATLKALVDHRWIDWFGGLDQGPMNTECFSGSGDLCYYQNQAFPNRTNQTIAFDV